MKSTKIMLWTIILILFASDCVVKSFAKNKTKNFFIVSLQQSTVQDNTRENNTSSLKAGDTIERKMKGGEAHSYLLKIMAGQYLDLSVEQKGIDVVVEVFDSTGNKLDEVDSPNGTQGDEPLKLLFDKNGSYILKISSLEPKAEEGIYKIKNIELRTATNKDIALTSVVKLNAEVEALVRESKYNDALPPAIKAVEVAEKDIGQERVTATSINNLGFLYQTLRQYDKAEPLLQKALDIRKKVLGEGHPTTITSINNLAGLYITSGKLEKAESLFKQAVDISTRVLGEDNIATANSVNNLAGFYEEKGEYDKAEPLYKRALSIKEKLIGKDNPDTAITLNNLAGLNFKKGNYLQAENLYGKAIKIYEQNLGAEHPDTINSKSNIALLYSTIGKYNKAETIYLKIMPSYKRILGAEHPKVSILINNLAQVYYLRGEYDKAEPLYKESLLIRKKFLQPFHPLIAAALNNLAVLYKTKGEYNKAQPLYEEALSIREKVFGKKHIDYVGSLNNLAGLHQVKGEYDKAESLFIDALGINKAISGDNHPLTVTSLNNLALVYMDKREYAKAEPLYETVLTLRLKNLGENHFETANAFNNLGSLYKVTGQYDKAEPLLVSAVKIYKQALGPGHPSTANTLNNLVTVYRAKGQIEKALKCKEEANESREQELLHNLTIGSEKQKLTYLGLTAVELDQTVSLHLQSAPDNKEAGRLALTTILRRKGRELDAMLNTITLVRNRAKVEDQQLLDELLSVRTLLSTLVLKGPNKEGLDKHLEKVKELSEKAEELEFKLSEYSSQLSTLQPIRLDDVQQVIPKNSKLIEFVSYYVTDNNASRVNNPRYAVYRLANDGQIEWTDLGEVIEIDNLIRKLRNVLQNPKSNLERKVKPTAQALYKKVIGPILKNVGENERLLISADGSLNLIPFETLVDEKGKYLIEKYPITYLTSGRDLLRLKEKRLNYQPPIIIAEPDYGAGGGPLLAGNQLSPLVPIPMGVNELKELRKLLPDAQIRIGKEATERAIKEYYRPQILHISTHGYFLTDSNFSSIEDKNEDMDDTEKKSIVESGVANLAKKKKPLDSGIKTESKTSLTANAQNSSIAQKSLEELMLEHPLLRSGLFFAGANQNKNEGEDGVMTALEVANLNLFGTKLVVLSGCETGLGDIKNGAGVQGLKRALILAGSESQLISLWLVNNQFNNDLIIQYYKLLKSGLGRGEALRKLQLTLITTGKIRQITDEQATDNIKAANSKLDKVLVNKKINLRHPFYWAAFILSGEWGNLEDK